MDVFPSYSIVTSDIHKRALPDFTFTSLEPEIPTSWALEAGNYGFVRIRVNWLGNWHACPFGTADHYTG